MAPRRLAANTPSTKCSTDAPWCFDLVSSSVPTSTSVGCPGGFGGLPADRQIQPIDVRDVAGFILKGLEGGVAGTFNVAAPLGHATYGSFLASCIAATASPAELVWVDDEFMLRHGVQQWTEIPLWRTYAGTWQVAADRARAAGLRCRPLGKTVRDTWAWLVEGGAAVLHERRGEHGITPDKEAQLLAAWESSAAS